MNSYGRIIGRIPGNPTPALIRDVVKSSKTLGLSITLEAAGEPWMGGEDLIFGSFPLEVRRGGLFGDVDGAWIRVVPSSGSYVLFTLIG